RNNPTLSPREAARAVGMPWGAFSMLIDAGPTIRDKNNVKAQLAGLEGSLLRDVNDWFTHLNRLIQGDDSDSSPDEELVRGRGAPGPGASHPSDRMDLSGDDVSGGWESDRADQPAGHSESNGGANEVAAKGKTGVIPESDSDLSEL